MLHSYPMLTTIKNDMYISTIFHLCMYLSDGCYSHVTRPPSISETRKTGCSLLSVHLVDFYTPPLESKRRVASIFASDRLPFWSISRHLSGSFFSCSRVYTQEMPLFPIYLFYVVNTLFPSDDEESHGMDMEVR